MSDDDEAMVYEAAGLLPDIIERLRREDPNHPIVKNMDELEEYAIRRYGSVSAAIRHGVAYDTGGWIGTDDPVPTVWRGCVFPYPEGVNAAPTLRDLNRLAAQAEEDQ